MISQGKLYASELMDDVGCPEAGELPKGIQIPRPKDVIIGGCGQVVRLSGMPLPTIKD